MSKPFTISTIASLGCHLVFAMTAGAYFLTQEPEPPKEEVRVTLVEKKKPDRQKIKEKKVQKKVEVEPVMKPVEVAQPISPQRVQVASAQVVQTDSPPVMMEQVQTPTSAPLAARVSSNVSSRALTAAVSSPRPMRSVPVASSTTGGSRVAPRTTSVRAYTAPDPQRVTQTPVVQTQGSSRTALKSTSVRTAISNAPAPKSLNVTSTQTRQGTSGVQMKTSSSAPVQMAAAAPVTPEVVDIAPELSPSTDPEVLDGYTSGVRRRLTYIAQKQYKRSTARRSNQEGKVTVVFTVTRDGDIKDAHVSGPSEYAMLNKTALDALKRAAPFTEFPEEIVESEIKMTIPFSFILR